MADIRTVFIDLEHGADYALTALGFEEDEGLDTAVIISLLTDARAKDDDTLPSGTDHRGWWGDDYAEIDGDKLGSRLWLLDREKQLPEVLLRARSYIQEALQWLVVDGVAESVEVQTFVPRDGILGAIVNVIRPDGQTTQFKFDNLWSAV